MSLRTNVSDTIGFIYHMLSLFFSHPPTFNFPSSFTKTKAKKPYLKRCKKRGSDRLCSGLSQEETDFSPKKSLSLFLDIVTQVKQAFKKRMSEDSLKFGINFQFYEYSMRIHLSCMLHLIRLPAI